MSLHSLPTGYHNRKAKFKDVPQLFLQIFESNSFNDYVGLTKHLLFKILTIGLVCYLIGFDYAKDRYEYGNTDFIDKILHVFKYRISDDTQDYDFILNEIASYFGIIFSLFCVLLASIIFAIYFSRNLYSKTWIIELNNQIIASARFTLDTSTLENIYVNPKFRYQGFASYLIKDLQKQFKQPIFIVCHRNITPFFENIGFVRDLEKQRQFAWGKGDNLIAMYYPYNKIESTNIENQLSYLQIIDKIYIRKSSQKDIDDINQVLKNNNTMDYFFPFGINFSWMYALVVWLFRLIFWYFLLKYEPIQVLVGNQLSNLLINVYFLMIISLMLMTIPSRILSRIKFIGIRKYSQFLLIEYDNKIIGYMRLLKQSEWYIINHFYIPNTLEEEIINHLIQKIVDKINKPILIACTKKEERLYLNIGFQEIDIQKLPEEMRIRGWLNQLFGGKNLIYLPSNYSLIGRILPI